MLVVAGIAGPRDAFAISPSIGVNDPPLQQRTGQRGVFPVMAPPTGTPTLSPPTTAGGGFPTGGDAAASHRVHGDDKHVAFSTTDQAPSPGEAHVYRVSATQQGVVFGGYTIVLMG